MVERFIRNILGHKPTPRQKLLLTKIYRFQKKVGYLVENKIDPGVGYSTAIQDTGGRAGYYELPIDLRPEIAHVARNLKFPIALRKEAERLLAEIDNQ